MFAALGSLGTILTIPFQLINSNKRDNNTEVLVQSYNILNSDREKTNATEKETTNPNETFKNALASKDFWICFFMGVCTLCKQFD